jgi:prepilin-type processing-associated H-X9-DG protein
MRPYLKHKYNEISQPAQTFTFIDDHEQTIDSGSFVFAHPIIAPGLKNQWSHLPSDRHNRGASVAFADGHAVAWHWKAPKIYRGQNQPATPGPDLDDLHAMQNWIPLE